MRRRLAATVADAVRDELRALGAGNVAVVVPTSLVEEIDQGLEAAGIAHGSATRNGLDQQVTVVPVTW